MQISCVRWPSPPHSYLKEHSLHNTRLQKRIAEIAEYQILWQQRHLRNSSAIQKKRRSPQASRATLVYPYPVKVLAEAQKFVAEANSPETATTTLSTKARPSQGHTSKSEQAKLWTDNTSEENKSKSSWKNSWLFWQRSKRNDSVNAYCSVSMTPTYPSRKAVKRSLSGPMASYSSTRKSSSNSGPIYSDGLPLRPANRSKSGSLSGSATPDRSYGIESPYDQLNSKAHSTYRHLYKV